MLRTATHFVVTVLLVCACRDRRPGTEESSSVSTRVALGAPTAGMADSATAFVRAIYSIYAPREASSGLAAVDSLVTERAALFAPTLRSALERDAAARAAATGEIVGLDFLPFLGAQDPCGRYEVGQAYVPDSASTEVRVPVHAVCAGVRESVPSAIVAVNRTQDGWAIANLYYPQEPGNLLAALAHD